MILFEGELNSFDELLLETKSCLAKYGHKMNFCSSKSFPPDLPKNIAIIYINCRNCFVKATIYIDYYLQNDKYFASIFSTKSFCNTKAAKLLK